MDDFRVSEMPYTPDESRPIRHDTQYGAVWCAPVQIVREGPWAGVWRVTRIWHESDKQPMEHCIGYVRFDLDEKTVHIRGNWEEKESRGYYPMESASLPNALKTACAVLLRVHAINQL